MKRIGLTQRVYIESRHGERRDCLDQRWAPFMMSCGYLPMPLSNSIENVGNYLREFRLDGVVLTGGNDIEGFGGTNGAPERDAFEHKLIDACSDLNIPVLGVCRGMQMLNVHHGGSLVDVTDHAGTEHSLDIVEPDFLGGVSKINVNSFHDFAITAGGLGAGLRPLALSDDGHVEAFRHNALKHLGIMWHPERERPFNSCDVEFVKRFFRNPERP